MARAADTYEQAYCLTCGWVTWLPPWTARSAPSQRIHLCYGACDQAEDGHWVLARRARGVGREFELCAAPLGRHPWFTTPLPPGLRSGSGRPRAD
jgi:hypothetical protein